MGIDNSFFYKNRGFQCIRDILVSPRQVAFQLLDTIPHKWDVLIQFRFCFLLLNFLFFSLFLLSFLLLSSFLINLDFSFSFQVRLVTSICLTDCKRLFVILKLLKPPTEHNSSFTNLKAMIVSSLVEYPWTQRRHLLIEKPLSGTTFPWLRFKTALARANSCGYLKMLSSFVICLSACQ